MHKKANKIIALVTLTAAFLFVAVGLNSATSSADAYYGGNYLVSSSYYVMPGTSFTVTGYRFYPNETVTVTVGDTTKQVVADGSGTFSTSVLANYRPHDGQGTVSIRAVGAMSNMAKTIEVVVAGFYPGVTPSTYFLYPHESVTWSGSAFAPNEMVNVYKNGAMIASATADGGGSFGGVTVSSHVAGMENYEFIGQTSGAHVSRSITIGSPWWN